MRASRALPFANSDFMHRLSTKLGGILWIAEPIKMEPSDSPSEQRQSCPNAPGL